jgi:GT2 family glycosyltransferase
MITNEFSMNKLNISIVIATLGGEYVIETIKALNRGRIVPNEVLICIPTGFEYSLDWKKFPNVQIIFTTTRGQVSQRVEGFRAAKNNYVLQLDDDVEVREDCLEKLIEYILTDDNCSVGPKMYDKETGKNLTFLTPELFKSKIYKSIIFWIINGSIGYKPGIISRAGINMGFLDNELTLKDIDWLPGGCILHHKKNIIYQDYYKISGKAFAEDLFHSVLLRNNGVKLIRLNIAVCDVHVPKKSEVDLIKTIKLYIKYIKTLGLFSYENRYEVKYLFLYFIVNIQVEIINKIIYKLKHHFKL